MIPLIFVQNIDVMYIKKYINFIESRVITKVYDSLGQPSYSIDLTMLSIYNNNNNNNKLFSDDLTLFK